MPTSIPMRTWNVIAHNGSPTFPVDKDMKIKIKIKILGFLLEIYVYIYNGLEFKLLFLNIQL